MSGEVELGEGSSSSVQRTETMIETPILCFRRRLRIIMFVLLLSWRLRPVRIPSLDQVVDRDDDDNDDDDDNVGGAVRAGDSDIEAGSAPCCRICLESDVEDDDELISPCMCRGTLQLVHRSCLDHWRSVKEGFDFSHCTTCKAQFHLRFEPFESFWCKLKFMLFVTRDVLLVFLAVQTAIAAIGAYFYFGDKDRDLMKLFNDRWDHILSKHPILFYYFLGVLILSVMVGFVELILHCFIFHNSHPEYKCYQCGSCGCCCGCGTFGCCYAPMKGCCSVVLIVCFIIFGILGIAYGFLSAIVTFQRFWKKHYYNLTKKELTKEYIVEDLHGCYIPPKLDPKHEERLKVLKLL